MHDTVPTPTSPLALPVQAAELSAQLTSLEEAYIASVNAAADAGDLDRALELAALYDVDRTQLLRQGPLAA